MKKSTAGIAYGILAVGVIAGGYLGFQGRNLGKLKLGNGAEALSGTAEGFGGAVTVNLARKEGKIEGVEIVGKDETPEVGQAAFQELKVQVLSAQSAGIDGVSGATFTSNAVRKAVAQALGEELPEEAGAESATETETAETEKRELREVPGGLSIGEALEVAHGEKSFAQVAAVVQGDKVVAAYIDEYQFMPKDSVTAVPNSDQEFGQDYAGSAVLASKRSNSAYYSGLMQEKAGATSTIDSGYDAIQNFAAGKTIEELEKTAAMDDAVDAVSGATLKDTANYLRAIVSAAKAAQNNQAVAFDGDLSGLRLHFATGAAHGTKCFSTAAVLTDGDRIVLSYLDEFLFLQKDGSIGVPNSDKKLGEDVKEGMVLASKRVNARAYSRLMQEKAGATSTIDGGYDAIQEAVQGMSIEEAEKLSQRDDAVDAVSGATLKDTANYVGLIVSAAKN